MEVLIVYYVGLFALGIIIGWILDLYEVYQFKKQLQEYNLLYPSFAINIPTKLKYLRLLKQNFEDFTFNMNMLHYTTPITNLPRIYGEATERKNDIEKEEKK